MFKKILGAASLSVLLTACGGDYDHRPMNDFTFQGSYEPGTYEDFKQNVGDRVFFALNSTHLSSGALAALDRQIGWLQQYPNAMFTIEGHADERGTSEYNLALGDRRAHAIRRYMVSHGISAGRISTVSFGKERPDAMGHNEGAWAKNRRGVVVVH